MLKFEEFLKMPQAKADICAGKMILSIWWDKEGVVYDCFIETWPTLLRIIANKMFRSSIVFCRSLLQPLRNRLNDDTALQNSIKTLQLRKNSIKWITFQDYSSEQHRNPGYKLTTLYKSPYFFSIRRIDTLKSDSSSRRWAAEGGGGETSRCSGGSYLRVLRRHPGGRTGILFVIRGDTFNKVWKCILWNIHIWRSCHGYERVMYDFPRRCSHLQYSEPFAAYDQNRIGGEELPWGLLSLAGFDE